MKVKLDGLARLVIGVFLVFWGLIGMAFGWFSSAVMSDMIDAYKVDKMPPYPWTLDLVEIWFVASVLIFMGVVIYAGIRLMVRPPPMPQEEKDGLDGGDGK